MVFSPPQDTYARLLLHHRHGYPLWVPEPNMSLPQEIYAQGIRVGDVGLVNEYGDFTSLFNIFLDSNHPVNSVHGVPAGFQPLQINQNLFYSRDNYHHAKVPISSKNTREVMFNADGTALAPGIPIGPGIGVELQFSRSQGAALMLPEGAFRVDYRGLPDVRDYAMRHAESWYQFLTEQVRMDAHNGSLYLVTGHDKTNCYENAAFSDSSKECSICLRFSSPLLDNGDFGRLKLSYSSSDSHMPSMQSSHPQHTLKNLSVFIRGFKIMIRRPPWLWRSSVKVMDVTKADPKEVMYRGSVPSVQSTPSSPQLPVPSPDSTRSSGNDSMNSSFAAASGKTSVTSCNASDTENGTSNSSPSDRGSSILDSDSEDVIYKLHHPSDVINEYMLQMFPEARVAIAHDYQWSLLLSEKDDEYPGDYTLLKRMKESFQIISDEGYVHLVDALSYGANEVITASSQDRSESSGVMEELLTPLRAHSPSADMLNGGRFLSVSPDLVYTVDSVRVSVGESVREPIDGDRNPVLPSLMDVGKSRSAAFNKFGTEAIPETSSLSAVEYGSMTDDIQRRGLDRHRERKLGEAPVVVDLTGVAQETDESGSSILDKKREEGKRDPEAEGIERIRLRKGKWPDDFMDIQNLHSSPTPPSPSSSLGMEDQVERSTSQLSSSPRKLATVDGGQRNESVESLPQFPRRPTRRARHSVDTMPSVLLPKDLEAGRIGRIRLGKGKWPDDFMDILNLPSTSDPLSRDSMESVRKPLIIKEEGKLPTHFQLGSCIGRGQFGSVYRALNLNTGHMVAVKQIQLEGLKEEEVTLLMGEVDLVKRLSHPSIIKYEGMQQDSHTLNIVLEYAENGSLAHTIKAFGGLNEKLVASCVVRILEGLHYLHQCEVVHCNLKAANILMTKNGNVKLSDFGVSLNMRAMEREIKDVAGTPNWTAPEVIEFKGASPKSDIWSLACTVIELLTGRAPYGDILDSMSVMFRIVEDDMPPIPPGCSPLLEDFLKKCFNKDPMQRPSAELLCEHQWLKQNWGAYEELGPQDSTPFLRRVSADLQKSEAAHYLSQIDMDGSQDHISALPPGRRMSNTSMRPLFDNEIAAREHSFVKTTSSKPMICRVCLLNVKKSAVLCEQCSLICHSKCAPSAPPTCDLRAQLLLYAQDVEKGNPGSAYHDRLQSVGFGSTNPRGSTSTITSAGRSSTVSETRSSATSIEESIFETIDDQLPGLSSMPGKITHHAAFDAPRRPSISIVDSSVRPRPRPILHNSRPYPLNYDVSSLPLNEASKPEQRTLIRTATSMLCKAIVKPPPHLKAGSRDWEEVEIRMNSLARLERVWGKSGSSNVQLGTSSIGFGEQRERQLFTEALRDGFVLCQLLNEVRSSNVVRPDRREDGFSRTSNIDKFLAGCASHGLSNEDLFFRDDLIDASSESLARVAKTIIVLIKSIDIPISEHKLIELGSPSESSYDLKETCVDANEGAKGVTASPSTSSPSAHAPSKPDIPGAPVDRALNKPPSSHVDSIVNRPKTGDVSTLRHMSFLRALSSFSRRSTAASAGNESVNDMGSQTMVLDGKKPSSFERSTRTAESVANLQTARAGNRHSFLGESETSKDCIVQ